MLDRLLSRVCIPGLPFPGNDIRTFPPGMKTLLYCPTSLQKGNGSHVCRNTNHTTSFVVCPLDLPCSAGAMLLLWVGHQGCEGGTQRNGSASPRVWGQSHQWGPGAEPLVGGSDPRYGGLIRLGFELAMRQALQLLCRPICADLMSVIRRAHDALQLQDSGAGLGQNICMGVAPSLPLLFP